VNPTVGETAVHDLTRSGAQAATGYQQVTAANPSGSYVLRVTNYLAARSTPSP
jgi:hypothetical protein